MSASAPLSWPTVQLLHELPDGTRHVDWMMAQDSRGRLPLITFRLEGRVDELADGERLVARRIDDHRREYLTYEGQISGDRGTVRRLARGMLRAIDTGPREWSVKVDWAGVGAGMGASQTLRLERADAGADQWTVTAGRRRDVEAKLEGGEGRSERQDHG